jgi:hypothetical protein
MSLRTTNPGQTTQAADKSLVGRPQNRREPLQTDRQLVGPRALHRLAPFGWSRDQCRWACRCCRSRTGRDRRRTGTVRCHDRREVLRATFSPRLPRPDSGASPGCLRRRRAQSGEYTWRTAIGASRSATFGEERPGRGKNRVARASVRVIRAATLRKTSQTRSNNRVCPVSSGSLKVRTDVLAAACAGDELGGSEERRLFV